MKCLNIYSISLNSESIPTSGLFEMANRVELVKLILWLAPSEPILPVPSESPVWHHSQGGCGDHKEHMADSVVDDESLLDTWEWSRDQVRIKDAGAVDRAEHAVVREPPGANDILHRGFVNDNWEWRSLVWAVNSLVTDNFP